MKKVAIIGSGPAALMCAHVLSTKNSTEKSQVKTTLFEKHKHAGRKLLIAGSSGLNISNSEPIEPFLTNYTGPQKFWDIILKTYTPHDWLKFIHDLGLETFEGTSRRYFIKGLKASGLLRAWLKELSQNGVAFVFEKECTAFAKKNEHIELTFSDGSSELFDAVCFCLGGASYQKNAELPRWPEMFLKNNISFTPFQASNAGYEISWKKDFLDEALRKPLKNIILTSSKGSKAGDILITEYGIEGTPVYFVGTNGTVHIDLKPDLTREELHEKCLKVKENLSPMRRIQKTLRLSDAAVALLFHYGNKKDLNTLLDSIKNLELTLTAPRPIDEAISTRGGISLNEVSETLMLKKIPGVFLAGEMLDWDAPTGGYLIQGCVSQGYLAAINILKHLK